MEIRWANIFGLILLIFGIYTFIKLRPFFERVFEDLNGGYYHRGDPLVGIGILGILCITFVGALKILSNRRR